MQAGPVALRRSGTYLKKSIDHGPRRQRLQFHGCVHARGRTSPTFGNETVRAVLPLVPTPVHTPLKHASSPTSRRGSSRKKKPGPAAPVPATALDKRARTDSQYLIPPAVVLIHADRASAGFATSLPGDRYGRFRVGSGRRHFLGGFAHTRLNVFHGFITGLPLPGIGAGIQRRLSHIGTDLLPGPLHRSRRRILRMKGTDPGEKSGHG